mmetsp:Transcript_41654/g.93995  ORF Transcript_41654/g.93995 Transcript_41654/m.93995 type:complete len:94 (-) Transcript_41654:603-884(-)
MPIPSQAKACSSSSLLPATDEARKPALPAPGTMVLPKPVFLRVDALLADATLTVAPRDVEAKDGCVSLATTVQSSPRSEWWGHTVSSFRQSWS